MKNRKTYEIIGGKLVRTQLFCPRCESGVFMADRGEFWLCGKCGDRYDKETFGRGMVRVHGSM